MELPEFWAMKWILGVVYRYIIEHIYALVWWFNELQRRFISCTQNQLFCTRYSEIYLTGFTVDFVMCPLFERHVSANKKNKPANLLILFLNDIE